MDQKTSSSELPLDGNLLVSSKVLGHISEGLYRGPAGVLKELISNAFDANARTVRISTGRPHFDVLSISDDGDGMTMEKFLEVVGGGIGDSDKRSRDSKLINGRQVIGRLGIGILGIAQLSHEFTIISHARDSRSAFEATVTMKDYRKEVLDRVTKTDTDGSNPKNESRDFAVGTYHVIPVEYQPSRRGMMITASDTTAGFRKQFSDDEPEPLPGKFGEFLDWCGVKDNLATGPFYRRLVWEIASLAPIPYSRDRSSISGDPNLEAVSKELRDFEFNVVVDGVLLSKPVPLQENAIAVSVGDDAQGEGPFHFPLEFESDVWGSPLKLTGYLRASRGKAIHPSAIRGILIRLKHVGIGGYDKSLLGYRYAEGPRFDWLTGELFVESGLEDALTVGRDTFDEGHPHFIALREWLHEQLRQRIFKTMYRGITARRIRREFERENRFHESFEEAISAFVNQKIAACYIEDSSAPPIEIDFAKGIAKINNSARWPRGKRQRELVQRISVIFELVRVAEPGSQAVEEFVRLVSRVIATR